MVCRPYHFEFFKGCLPQISLGSFLNTWSQMFDRFLNNEIITEYIKQ